MASILCSTLAVYKETPWQLKDCTAHSSSIATVCIGTIILENVEHCGGKPEQAATMVHAHEQTKLNAEMMSWIASVYEYRLYTTLT